MRIRPKALSVLAAVMLFGAAGTVTATTEPPAGTEPAGTEPAGTEPAGTEPAGTEPAGTEAPAATEPPGRRRDDRVRAASSGDADLVIWADRYAPTPSVRSPSRSPTTNGIVVEVVFVPVRPNPRQRSRPPAPTGEGPDIIVGAHDWLGEFVVQRFVDPLDSPRVRRGFHDGRDRRVHLRGAALRRALCSREHRPRPQHRPRPRGAGDVRGARGDRPAARQPSGDDDGPAGDPEGRSRPLPPLPVVSAFGGYIFGVERGRHVQPRRPRHRLRGWARRRRRSCRSRWPSGPAQRRCHLRRDDRRRSRRATRRSRSPVRGR